MKLKRFLCMLLLCALLLPSMPALAIPINEAPSEEEVLETLEKGFVYDTKIMSCVNRDSFTFSFPIGCFFFFFGWGS